MQDDTYQNAAMDMFMTRELANSFGNSDDEEEMYRRIFGSSSKDKTTTTTTKKPKYDAEEIREIEAKANGRRKKAYKNYEDACKVKGKFTVRSCPKIEDCYAKNKIKFIPLLAEKTTPAPTTTTKKAIGKNINKEQNILNLIFWCILNLLKNLKLHSSLFKLYIYAKKRNLFL